MSFSGERSRSAVYSSMVVLMIIFLVLQIWALNTNCCVVTATRTPPLPPPPLPPSAKDSDDLKTSELYKRFFNGRYPPKDQSFDDFKRRVPSCPDPLHN
ncbi:hypothetical protein E3N88_37659 [Mikania micrantha]|uniref:Uncharacterized protein n=1 Tax=Mikania micrantha TaxID=192012 RepID=A0A5N6LU32_9ASTR|nr:hypothetical protein E3N88_37659 [Mikania micrantha]